MNATAAAAQWFGNAPADKKGVALTRWSALDIAARFAIAAAAGIALMIAILSWWVSGKIARGIIYHTASNVALHLDDAFELQIQTLIANGDAGGEVAQSLKAAVAHHAAEQMLLGVTIWGKDNAVVYASNSGEIAVPPAELRHAWKNSVEGRLDTNDGLFSRAGDAMPPALHVFAPMHAQDGKTPIAILEVATNASSLANDVRDVRLKTAGVAGLLTLAMTGLLFRIVRQGSRTIRAQEADLLQRIDAMRRLLDDNQDLQQRVIEATHRSNETNDRTLRRIGAELHDGPAQLIALSLLRLEALRGPLHEEGKNSAAEEIQSVETLMRDCLNEVRQLSSGLALPKLDGVSVRKALELAINNHERRSRTRVERDLSDDLPAHAPRQVLTFLYRFTQEGLNNALKHAGGKGQAITAHLDNGNLIVAVHDRGLGCAEHPECLDKAEFHGLGLIGLRDRLEAFGGSLEISPREGGGTSLTAKFNLDHAAAHDGRFL